MCCFPDGEKCLSRSPCSMVTHLRNSSLRLASLLFFASVNSSSGIGGRGVLDSRRVRFTSISGWSVNPGLPMWSDQKSAVWCIVLRKSCRCWNGVLTMSTGCCLLVTSSQLGRTAPPLMCAFCTSRPVGPCGLFSHVHCWSVLFCDLGNGKKSASGMKVPLRFRSL